MKKSSFVLITVMSSLALLLPAFFLITKGNNENYTQTVSPPEAQLPSTFIPNYPEYELKDPLIYETIKELAKTEPKYDAQTGLFSLVELWARVMISDDSNITYRIDIYSTYTQDNKIELNANILRVMTKENECVTIKKLGCYENSTITKLLTSAICDKHSLVKPEVTSERTQTAAPTQSYHSITDQDFIEKTIAKYENKSSEEIEDLTCNPKTHFILDPQPIKMFSKNIFMVSLHQTHGVVRIEKTTAINDSNIEEKITTKYFKDPSMWDYLRNYQNHLNSKNFQHKKQ